MSTLSQFTGGGIKSVQRGTITILGGVGTTATATINAVNTNKSMLTYLGQSGYYSTSTNQGISNSRIALTSSTQITATTIVTPATTNYVISYEVIEFN